MKQRPVSFRACFVLCLAVTLTACVSPTAPVESSGQSEPAQAGRYEMEHDNPALEPFDLSRVEPVIPVAERRTIAGNKSPYTVLGRTYRVMQTEAGYSATGYASWYGRKFHGHKTSNGEVYDMFQLSAAHRTLPIPSYVRVTNLENGRQLVVRVNDRGPFHDNRIIDLSYAAATMLGFAEQGTAQVRVEAIVPGTPRLESQPLLVADRSVGSGETPGGAAGQASAEGSGEYLQVGAFASLEIARGLLARLEELTSLPAFIRSEQADGSGQVLHRVRLGPLDGGMDVNGLIKAIVDADLGTPFRVRQ